ncbi:MAG TPA: MFS transporter [Pseudonocardiaceae bacterium]|nr:MFS transporter [Pseudonocardiaceae bacterium]
MADLSVVGARAGRREWLGLAVLVLPTLLVSADVSVLFLALPKLSMALGADTTQQLWIVDIYGFTLAGFLVTMGSLGDRIGRRKLLLWGVGAFGAASVVAAFSTSPQMLIAARAVLGVAGATLAPCTLSLISNIFHRPNERNVAIGVWTSCFVGGMAIGPLVGAALLSVFWWGSAFLVGVPIMVVVLVLVPLLLPEYRAARTAGRLDPLSVVLVLGTVLPLVYGLKELVNVGVQPVPLVALAIGLLLGLAFVRRQNRLATPLLDLRLFGNRTFRTALLLMLVCSAVLGGVYLLVSLDLQLVHGLSPLSAGLWLLVPIGCATLSSLAAPVLAGRYRPGTVVVGAIGVTVIGLLVLVFGDPGGHVGVLVVGFSGLNLGIVPLVVLTTGLTLGSVPPEQAGAASGVSETGGELGFALGVAVLGSLSTLVYRTQVTYSLPTGTTARAARSATDSLAGATADHVPGAVLHVARTAFSTGLTVVAAVSAAALAVLAVAAAVQLRHLPPAGPDEPGEAPAQEPVAAASAR